MQTNAVYSATYFNEKQFIYATGQFYKTLFDES